MNRVPRHQYPRLKKRIITGTRIQGEVSRTKEEKSFFQRNNIDIAVLVAILTALAYAIAYCYKLAQFHYFHIPIELIDINLKNVMWIILVFTVVAFLMYFIFVITNHIEFAKRIFRSDLFKAIIGFALSLISSLLSFLAQKPINNLQIFNHRIILPSSLQFQVLAIISFFIFINSLNMVRIRIRGKKPKVANLISTLMLGISLFSLPYSLGYYVSYISSHHYLVEGTSFSVVLTTYKDQFIVAPVDLEKKVVTPEFSFIKIETNENGIGKIKVIKTGRLIVKNPKTAKDLLNQNKKKHLKAKE